MPASITRLAAVGAAFALLALAGCEINTPSPAPVVVNPQPHNPPVVVQTPSPPPPPVVVAPQ